MITSHRPALGAALTAVLALTLAACGQSTAPGSPGTSPGTAPDDALSGELVVLAAASLQDAFDELGAAFHEAHPGVTVTFSYGGSSGLAEQIVAGAPADVFAAASTSTMETAVHGLQDAGVAGADALSPTLFASNSMVLAVPLANEAGVQGLADLERDDVTFAVCEEAVPCGAAAVRVLQAAGVTAAPVTLEKDVTAVLIKVRDDEVDAGIVYVTDLDESVTGIEVPADVNTTTSYPILALPEAPHPETAAAFTDFVLSAEGLAVLASHGFAAP